MNSSRICRRLRSFVLGLVVVVFIGAALAVAPVVTTHPGVVTVISGQNATFTVEASGSGTLSYQWRHLGVPVDGAFTESLTLTNVTMAEAGFYDVVVSDGAESITSQVGQLLVAPPSYGTTFRLDPTFPAVFERQGAGITALAVAPSGESYVTGTFTTLDGQRRDGFARLSGASTLDAGFNPAVSGTVTGVLPQGSEWVVIGGSFTEVNGQARRGLARLSADGLTVDPAFMPELVCNGTRGRIVQQPDGKLLVVGGFVDYPHGNLVRLNTDGTLDPTWAPTGVGAQWPNSLVVQSDGKIVVAVTHYDGNAVPGIARLNADGTLDTSFAVGAGFNSEVKALALQPDGKILVVGGFTSYDGTPCANLARINTAGTLDPSLSAGSGFGPNVSADALLLQPDGRIVLGGSFSNYNGTACGALIRIDSTGLLEPTFAAGALPAAGVRALGYDAANGQLVVAGTFTTVGASATSGQARYTLAGTAVNALAGGERVEATVLAAVPVSGGDWVVAGDFTLVNGVAQNRIARLNSDGSLDSGFAVGSGFDRAVSALARTGDGKLLVGGAFTSFNGTDCNGLARVAADGSFDAAFAIGTGFNSPNGHNIGYLTVMGDGRVVVAGEFTAYDGEPARYIIRLQSDGARDVSFSNWAPDLFIPQGLAVEADGRILSGSWVLAMNGWTFSRQGGARLLANGSLDPSFDPTTNGVGVGPWAFALQPDGKFIVAGFQSAASPLRLGVARFNNDGSFDPTYGSATMMIGTPTSINLQPDGRLLAAGYLNYGGSPRSAGRYLADGTQDPTFATFDGDTGPFAGNGNSGACYTDDGRILVPGVTGRRGSTRQIGLALLRPEVVPAPVIATQPAAWQTAVVGGTTILSVEATSSVPLNYQWRKQGVAIPGATGKRFTLPSATMADAGAYDVLVSDGVTSVASQTVTFAVAPPSYGTTFRLDKSFSPLFEQSGASVNVLGLVGDGSCYIAGGFSTLDGQRRPGVARLGLDGSLDLGFAPAFNAPIAAMISLGGDGVLVGGRFSEVNGAACSGLVRLSADGATVDPSFGAELGFGTVSRMLRQEDGKILVQGVFDGYTKGTLARLNADGTLDATWQPGAAGLSETESLALQPDGKILVGTWSSGASLPSRIVRLNGDGSVDPTFVYNPTTLENLTGLSVQSDGRVLVAGPYTAGSTDKRAKIVRLNGDGTVDGSFSTGAGFQDYDAISAVVPLPDGTILVGGRFTALNGTACACVVRLTATGALVEPQGADWPRSPVRALAYDAARSQVVLAGDFTALGATASSGFARFALDETLVATNAAGGRFGGYVSATVPVSGGDWVVGGSFTHVNGVPQRGIARLHADGSVDASFAPGGFDGPVYAAVRTGDGKLVVGGAFSQLAAGAGCNRIARLYADGSFDPTFESGAGITGNRVSHLVAMRDGRIVAAGDFASYDGVSAPYIVRLLDSGRLDTSFARVLNAITTLGLGVDDLGRVYEGAWWTSANGWSFSRLGGARLNADGQLDSSWNLAGSGGPITYPTAFAFQPDGKIIVAGFWGLARFGSDGAWDRSYAAGTHANISSGLTLLPDGRVLASAGYTEDSERSRSVVRFGTTGRFDSTFGAFDYAFPVIPKEEWCGNGARYTDDGRILVPNVNGCREGQWQYGLVMLKPDEDPRPAITASPTSQTVAPGAPATFAVTATGGHLRYQWFKDGMALPGKNQPVLVLPAAAAADFGAYIARVENDAGSATSQAAVLAVGSLAAPRTVYSITTTRSPLVIPGSTRARRMAPRAPGSTSTLYG
ncbi:MAG: immunoglobulin domain-containing protein [Opitutaceae bacterium]|nr:immunoglobulin domain-containing protein [Opitutaceae bacterium]